MADAWVGQDAPRSSGEADASGFVLLTDVVPDALLEMRYASTYNFTGDVVDGYEQPVALVTREAARALRRASELAREQGCRLKVWDAYRPQRAVDHFVRWAADVADVRMKGVFYPDVDKACLFDEGYIACRSSHTRGSTVDLTLMCEATGREADMGGPFDFFGELSHPDYAGALTESQRGARRLLADVMAQAGFVPIDSEWWHFTLADEPYPDTYFTFPVRADMVGQSVL